MGYVVSLTGEPFNDAYRYVDWVLTVPLLLIELILVMGLPAEETASKSWKLGVASLTGYARWLTIISWLTYPGVYIIKMIGISGVAATAGEQIGYSIADVVAKAVFGVLIWAIASEKSKLEEGGLLA